MVNYPSDWDKIKLLELMTPYNGLSGKSGNDFINGKEKYINYLSVFNNTVIEVATEKVNIYNGEIQNIVNKGDVLFTQSSETAEEVGMASTYLGDEKVYLNSFCFGARKKREFDSFFMVSLLRSKTVRDKISKEGQGSTRYNLSPTRLLNIEINMPKDVDEQKAISKVLLTFDKHIENLSKLIEKKKIIRDGAVEDLVSGEKRLSNFSGEWDYKPVKSITKDVITGGTPSTNIKEYWGGSIPWLASTEIHQKNIRNATKNISDLGLLNSSAKIAPKDSVLIALAGQGKTRGTAAILGKNMAINQSLAALVCNEDNYYKFLFYAIEMNYEALRELSSGDGGRGGLNKKLIKDFKINIPSDKNEQTAIADILSSMDKEIENLEKEKEKYLQLKSGAMDDLLTGKIRLV